MNKTQNYLHQFPVKVLYKPKQHTLIFFFFFFLIGEGDLSTVLKITCKNYSFAEREREREKKKDSLEQGKSFFFIKTEKEKRNGM